jgi:hypothetical protein
MFRIVSLNFFTGLSNLLENGFSTYDEADEAFCHWRERFPNYWIRIEEQVEDGRWIEAIC